MEKGRTRRKFEAAFKVEAVRRMHERRAAKVPMAVIATDIGVRPEQLRSWANAVSLHHGEPARDVFPGEGRLPSAEEELRQVRRDLDVARQEVAFLKKAAAYFATGSR